MSVEGFNFGEPAKPEKKLETAAEAVPVNVPEKVETDEKKKAEPGELREVKLRTELSEKLLEREAAAMRRAREIFSGNDWRAFVEHLSPNLHYLFDSFKKWGGEQARPFDSLPPEMMMQIVGHDYLRTLEEHMTKLAHDHGGVYLPLHDSGGGDYLDWHDNESGEINIRLGDFTGHGVEALLPKAIIRRFIELRDQDPTASADNFFADLDALIESLPYGSRFMEFMEIKARSAESGLDLEIESAGQRILVRHLSGEIEVVTTGERGYPLLGFGAAKGLERQITKLSLEPGAAIFLYTDGLYEMRISTDPHHFEQFLDILHEFAAQRVNLSQVGFNQELLEYIRRAKREGRVGDDVSGVMFPPPTL